MILLTMARALRDNLFTDHTIGIEILLVCLYGFSHHPNFWSCWTLRPHLPLRSSMWLPIHPQCTLGILKGWSPNFLLILLRGTQPWESQVVLHIPPPLDLENFQEVIELLGYDSLVELSQVHKVYVIQTFSFMVMCPHEILEWIASLCTFMYITCKNFHLS